MYLQPTFCKDQQLRCPQCYEMMSVLSWQLYIHITPCSSTIWVLFFLRKVRSYLLNGKDLFCFYSWKWFVTNVELTHAKDQKQITRKWRERHLQLISEWGYYSATSTHSKCRVSLGFLDCLLHEYKCITLSPLSIKCRFYFSLVFVNACKCISK